MGEGVWCELLPHVELACNSTVAVSTGVSPCELVFGAPVQLPIDVMVNADVSNDSAVAVASRVRRLVEAARAHM